MFMTSAYEGGHIPQIEVRHRLRIAREYADTVEATGINPGMVLWPNPAADLLARWQR